MKDQVDAINELLRTAATLAPAVPADAKARRARALYLECCETVLAPGAIRVHVLVSPVSGHHAAYCAGDEPDLAWEVASMTGKIVRPGDMIVVMGDGAPACRDSMMETVMSDLAAHLNAVWPAASQSAGSAGRKVGFAAYAAVMAAAAGQDVPDMLGRISRCATTWIEGGPSSERPSAGFGKASSRAGGEGGQNAALVETVEGVCRHASETLGGWLSLPAAPAAIAMAAKAAFVEASDLCSSRPGTII